jgi:glycosyltransferase involved in cell wall biosynthesis
VISVVLPAFNEEPYLADTVDELIDGLTARGRAYEILVVENGSSDRTRQVADDLATRHAAVRSLSIARPDYGGALRHGFLHAGGTMVCNFDVDYFDLTFLDRAIERIEGEGYAMVVAAKRGEGASDTRALPRRLVTAVFATVLKRGFHLDVVDTHGMKVMQRATLEPLVAQTKSGTDLYDTELIIRVERAGLRVAAIPVVVEERRASRTSIVKRIPRTLRGLGRLWLQLRREGREVG